MSCILDRRQGKLFLGENRLPRRNDSLSISLSFITNLNRLEPGADVRRVHELRGLGMFVASVLFNRLVMHSEFAAFTLQSYLRYRHSLVSRSGHR